MPISRPSRLLFLDLRACKRLAPPDLDGLEAVNPSTDGECQAATAALAIFVAIDGDAAYEDWRQRFHPMCPNAFPHVVLLDPYCPNLARRALNDDAADCCALNDLERLALIVARLERQPRETARSDPERDELALFLRLQTTLDTLPSPIFIKNSAGRYIACNKAFEDYLGLSRAKIVGRTVYDIAPRELAVVYEKADQELMQRGGTQSYEANVRYADGTDHDVIFHKSVFLNAAGEVDGISGTMLDISERKRLEQRLAVAASTDFLTGILNLRTFYDLASHEFRRFVRNGGNLSLIVIDLDHFKEINDNFGHDVGDAALRELVGAVKDNLRDQDIFARAGGDEFRILLPGTPTAGAALVAERIRLAVNRLSIDSPRGSTTLTISAGICSCQPGDESLDDVTKRADAALYMAKAAGRNCIHPQFAAE